MRVTAGTIDKFIAGTPQGLDEKLLSSAIGLLQFESCSSCMIGQRLHFTLICSRDWPSSWMREVQQCGPIESFYVYAEHLEFAPTCTDLFVSGAWCPLREAGGSPSRPQPAIIGCATGLLSPNVDIDANFSKTHRLRTRASTQHHVSLTAM